MASMPAIIDTIFDEGTASNLKTASTGNWADAGTWTPSEVPTTGDQVHIPAGVTVTYNYSSTDELDWVKVDGTLTWSTSMTTLMEVETLLITDTGIMNIASSGSPLSDAYTATIRFVGEAGDIDVAVDTRFISRGLISWGQHNIYGAEKTPFLPVASNAGPLASATTLTLASAPTGWKVGDEIIITGTTYKGWISNSRQNEEQEKVTITAIDSAGTGITFTPALSNNHDGPKARFRAHVANLTRNIIFETQNGASTVARRRAHTMFHDHRTHIHHVFFKELGRTDKSTRSNDIDTFDPLTSSSNIQGRYACHLHLIPFNSEDTPTIYGCSLEGSPGWGFVQHGTHAFLDNLVSYNVFGCHVVAENSGESGHWRNCIAIYSEGYTFGDAAVKDSSDYSVPDRARVGIGFYFQGRGLEARHNVAAGVNHGFVYMHRGGQSGEATPKEAVDTSDFGNFTTASVFNQVPPITDFANNEAYCCWAGMNVVKELPNQFHPGRTILRDFRAWNVAEGGEFEYTSHYTMINFDMLAADLTGLQQPNTPSAIKFGPNTSDMALVDFVMEDFSIGLGLNKFAVEDAGQNPYHGWNHLIVNDTYTNVTTPISYDTLAGTPTTEGAGTARDTLFLSHDDLDIGRMRISGVSLRGAGVDWANNSSLGWREARYGNAWLEDSASGEWYPAGQEGGPEEGTGQYYYWSYESTNAAGTNAFAFKWGYFTGTGIDTYALAWPIWAADRATADMYILGTFWVDYGVDFNFAGRTSVVTETFGESYRNRGAYAYASSPIAGPTIPDQFITARDGESVVVNPFTGVTHPNGDTMEIYAIRQPAYGTVVDNGDDTVTFTPDPIYQPLVDHFFIYTLDEHGNFNNVKVTVNSLVKGVSYEEAPVALGMGF